jgi:hypothetical protein
MISFSNKLKETRANEVKEINSKLQVAITEMRKFYDFDRFNTDYYSLVFKFTRDPAAAPSGTSTPKVPTP